jgi:hypothetical protein
MPGIRKGSAGPAHSTRKAAPPPAGPSRGVPEPGGTGAPRAPLLFCGQPPRRRPIFVAPSRAFATTRPSASRRTGISFPHRAASAGSESTSTTSSVPPSVRTSGPTTPFISSHRWQPERDRSRSAGGGPALARRNSLTRAGRAGPRPRGAGGASRCATSNEAPTPSRRPRRAACTSSRRPRAAGARSRGGSRPPSRSPGTS